MRAKLTLIAVLMLNLSVAPASSAACTQAPFPIVLGGTNASDSTLFYSMTYNAATDSIVASGSTTDFQSTGLSVGLIAIFRGPDKVADWIKYVT